MPTNLSAEHMRRLYQQMVTMRFFEIQLTQESKAGNIRGSLHLATGQEALPAGTCLALTDEDAITMTYRGHGYALAKGCDLTRVAAETLGRSTGLSHGKGGKMHLFDPAHGVLGTNGIVGAGVPTALGAALAAKTLKTGNWAVTVFGDGALNQGVVSECFNLAALWQLPAIFLCENNLYAEMTPLNRSSSDQNLCHRAEGFGIRSLQIDGNDPVAVYEAVSEARSQKGPTFIEAMTYRTCGHYHLDPGIGSYRTKEEVEKWEGASPISRFAKVLLGQGLCTQADLNDIEKESEHTVTVAFDAAKAAPFPADSTATEGVFV